MTRVLNNNSRKYTVLLLLFLAFVLYNSMLPGITYYAAIFCILVMLNRKANRRMDKNFLLIFVFAFLYGLIPLLSGITASPKNLICCIVPPTFYLFGKYLVDEVKTEKSLTFITVAMLLFFALNTYMICVSDIVQTGSVVNVTRTMSRYFGKQEAETMSATGFGINISLGLVGLAMFVRASVKNISHYLLLGIFFLSLLVTVHLVNRTGIIVSVLVTIGVLMLSFSSNNKRKLIWTIVLLFVCGFFFYQNNNAFSEIIDAYVSREDTEMHSGMLDTGSRSWRWVDGLGRLFTDPFGYAKKMPEGYFVHNLWLDVSRWSGTIPSFLVLVITIKMALLSWRSVRLYHTEFTFLIFGLCLCSLLTFFMEPVMEGSAIYFYLFCLFFGMLQEYTNCKRSFARNSYAYSSK